MLFRSGDSVALRERRDGRRKNGDVARRGENDEQQYHERDEETTVGDETVDV